MPNAVGMRGTWVGPRGWGRGLIFYACPVQLGAESPEEQPNTDYPMLDPDMNAFMDEGFYFGMVQATDRARARFGHCFNCLEEGYRWRDCKKMPILPELQDILDRDALNRKGGAGGK